MQTIAENPTGSNYSRHLQNNCYRYAHIKHETEFLSTLSLVCSHTHTQLQYK